MITPYSQRDPKWRDKELDGSGLKIGDYGCFIVAIASIDGRTPDLIRQILGQAGCISAAGLLDAPKAAKTLGYTYERVEKNPNKICIAEINYSPQSGIQTHFVIWMNDPTSSIMDTWDGKIKQNHWKVISYRIFTRINPLVGVYPARPPEPDLRPDEAGKAKLAELVAEDVKTQPDANAGPFRGWWLSARALVLSFWGWFMGKAR